MPNEMPEGANKVKSSQGNSKWPFWLLSLLVALALGGFAYVLLDQWVSGQQLNGADGSRQTDEEITTEQSGEPLSILPDTPEGVTVIQKQPDLPDSETGSAQNGSTLTSPIAQGAEVATGFAMDLGNADAFLELSQRFAVIAETNGAENFQRLEPRATLRETVSGLEARLLVGPFQTSQAAAEACSVLILDPQIECTVAAFEGELIPRE